MANIKISELEEYTQAKDNDLLVIVDTTNNETKKIENFNLYPQYQHKVITFSPQFQKNPHFSTPTEHTTKKIQINCTHI